MRFFNFNLGSWLPANEIAVDLGTANTLVYVKGEGIVLNEPSVVAIEKATGGVLGIGLEAKRMLGRTPDGIAAVRPLKDGVIADFDVTERMLRYFLKTIIDKHVFRVKPRVIIAVPSGITEVERRAVRDSAENRLRRPLRRPSNRCARSRYCVTTGSTISASSMPHQEVD